MKLSAKKKMLEQIEKKIESAFATMLESAKEEDIKLYESLVARADDLEKEIEEDEAKEERNDLNEGKKDPYNKSITKPTRSGELSEAAEAFGRSLVEAVAKGTTFQGMLPRDVAQTVQRKKEQIARVRGKCSVHQTNGEYTVYVDGDAASVAYVGEGAALGETSPTIKPVALAALKLGALIKVSSEYISDLGVDIIGYLTDVLSKAFAKKEDHEILFGAGTSMSKTAIRGVASNTGVGTVTAADQTTVTWEEVKQTIQKIGAYRSGATIFCSQAFLDIVHSFKDDTTYMFPQNQQIGAILGVPVVVSDAFETIAAGKVVMVVGDFSYYHILDRAGLDIKTLYELYAATDQVGISAIERIDGDMTAPEAFAVLKTAEAGE